MVQLKRFTSGRVSYCEWVCSLLCVRCAQTLNASLHTFGCVSSLLLCENALNIKHSSLACSCALFLSLSLSRHTHTHTHLHEAVGRRAVEGRLASEGGVLRRPWRNRLIRTVWQLHKRLRKCLRFALAATRGKSRRCAVWCLEGTFASASTRLLSRYALESL